MACYLFSTRPLLEPILKLIVNRTPRNKLQWKLNQSPMILIQENALVNVVCKTSAILFRPQCVKIAKFWCDTKDGTQLSTTKWNLGSNHTEVKPRRHIAQGLLVWVVSITIITSKPLFDEVFQVPQATGGSRNGPVHLHHIAVDLQTVVGSVPVNGLEKIGGFANINRNFGSVCWRGASVKPVF